MSFLQQKYWNFSKKNIAIFSKKILEFFQTKILSFFQQKYWNFFNLHNRNSSREIDEQILSFFLTKIFCYCFLTKIFCHFFNKNIKQQKDRKTKMSYLLTKILWFFNKKNHHFFNLHNRHSSGKINEKILSFFLT